MWGPARQSFLTFTFHPEPQELVRQDLKYREVSESYVNSACQIIISRINLSQWTHALLRGPRGAALCWNVPRTPGTSCRWGEHSSQCLGIAISCLFYRSGKVNNKIPLCASNVTYEEYSQRLEISLQELPQAIFQLHKCHLIFWLNQSLHKHRQSLR